MSGRLLIPVMIVLFMLNACNAPAKKKKFRHDQAEAQKVYAALVDREALKNEQADSIFYGIYFKMTKNSFFHHCNEMFRKGIFKGSYDYQVVVDLPDKFTKNVTLKFYPTFEKPFISKLQCRFQYEGANLYHKDERADALARELVPVLMKWYGGNAFIEMPSQHPLKGPEYVKVDANRKIKLSESDNGIEVEAVFEDLKPLY